MTISSLAFVLAGRRRRRDGPAFMGAIRYWSTEDGRAMRVYVRRERKRLERLAAQIGYAGPLFGVRGNG